MLLVFESLPRFLLQQNNPIYSGLVNSTTPATSKQCFQTKNCKVKVIRTPRLLAKFQSRLPQQLSSQLFHMSCSTAVPPSSRKRDFTERESEQFLPLAYFIIYCSISLHSSGIFCANSFHYSQSHTNSSELSSENSQLPAKTSNKKLPGKVTKDF